LNERTRFAEAFASAQGYGETSRRGSAADHKDLTDSISHTNKNPNHDSRFTWSSEEPSFSPEIRARALWARVGVERGRADRPGSRNNSSVHV